MGKRGPAAKGEYADKSAVLSTRISGELRAHLEGAKKKSGLTLSREIEHRLRRSFEDDKLANETFGSRRNRALMKIIALSMQTALNPSNPDAEADWLDDPVLFEMVHRAINQILNGYRPPGAQPSLDAFQEIASVDGPARAMQKIQEADETLPINVSEGQRLANLIKSDLAGVASRPKLFEGTADDMRRHADKLEKEERKQAQSQKRGRRK